MGVVRVSVFAKKKKLRLVAVPNKSNRRHAMDAATWESAARHGQLDCLKFTKVWREAAFKEFADSVWEIARGRASELSFENVYRRQYNLVVHGHGSAVYWFLRLMLCKMSLCMRKEAFNNAVKLLYNVSLFLDNRWCHNFQLPGLLDSAAEAYDRPVARRWRRALFMARWQWRLNKWRAVFTEEWLRPEGVYEQLAAKRFKTSANECG